MNEYEDISKRHREANGAPLRPDRGRSEAGFDLDARDIMMVVTSQSRTIIAAALLVLAIAVIAILQVEKKYTATALLEIDPSEAELIGIGEQKGLAGTTLNSLIDTKVEVLSSSSVSLDVIKSQKLWLDQEIGLDKSLWEKLLSLVQFSQSPAAAPPVASFDELADDQRSALVSNLAKRVRISQRGLTSVIAISATSVSPEKAALLSNAIANAYIDIDIGTRVQSARRAAEFLETQLNLLADAIKNDDAEISRLVLENSSKIGSAETQALLESYKKQFASLEIERTQLLSQTARLREISVTGNFEAAAQINMGTDFGSLVAKQKTLAASVAQGDLSLKEQLAQAENELRALALSQLSASDRQVESYDGELSKIRKQIKDTIGSQTVPPDLAIGLYRLQKRQINNQRLYDSYAARLGDAQQVVGLPISSSRLVAAALTPYQPDWPSRRLLLMLSAVASLGFGVGVGFLRHYYIGGFTSTTQLEAVGGHQVIANVVDSDDDPLRAIFETPNSAFVESVRRVRIGVESTATGGGQRVLVTSTEPGEGKTTIAVTLARDIALTGQRVLLIDSDLRRPSVAKYFKAAVAADLIDAIMARQHATDLSEFVWREPETGLDVLFASERGEIASDLVLGSAGFSQILGNAAEMYDIVVLDSPPIGQVVDALILQRSADLVLYVVRAGATSQREVAAGVRQMERQPVSPPIYFVLNRTKNMLTGYGYPLGRKYGYN